MLLRLPIGYDNFGKIREKNLDFVDKTLFIQEILDEITTEVILITRPRRFGKTLNLSMLQHFLAAEVYGCKTKGLFDDLKIAALGSTYMQYQGKYPVIFITLKDVQDHRYETAYAGLTTLLRQVCREHDYLLSSTELSPEEKFNFEEILRNHANEGEIKSALQNLSHYLFKHHGVKPWLLIDEYDTPLQSAFLHGYYEEMISLMRGFLGAALKTNPYLEKAVITGILRISKESLFSGLNNLKVYTVLQQQYSDCFGFTETEVSDLLQRSDLSDQAPAIKHWYNGYLMGNTVIYNPWSIVNCIHEKGLFRPYWVNTSGNDLIKRLLAQGDEKLKENLELLLVEKPICAVLNENMVFSDIDRNQDVLWSLLLLSGYLKAIETEQTEVGTKAILCPPNYEVFLLYRALVQEWFSHPLGYENYTDLLQSLLRGNVEEFNLRLQDCLLQVFSIFDVTGQHPEKFYHGFVLGLVVSLNNTHRVQSNRESGYGRYDVMLIPKDATQLGIVMEFKTVRDDKIDLQQAAQQALQQVIDRHYAETLKGQGITKILQLGLAFRGKTVHVVDRLYGAH